MPKPPPLLSYFPYIAYIVKIWDTVGHSPTFNENRNLARKLAKIGLESISRLLLSVGKPFYLVVLIPLVATFYFFKVAKQVLGFKSPIIHLSRNRKRMPKKGIIYSSKWFKAKSLISNASRLLKYFGKLVENSLKDSQKASYDIYWKTQVFFLALEKLLVKLFVYSKKELPKFRIEERLALASLSLRIRLVYVFSLLPKPKFPKISKLKIAFYFFSFIFLVGFVGMTLFWFFILRDLPAPTDLTKKSLPISTKIYDRNGELLYTVYKDQNRTPVALEEIPLHVRLATLAAEDAEFYSHPGFSIKGITRAMIKNFKEGKVEGGSTITQQLVKNAFLSPEKTIIRKLKEIFLAIEVELTFTKDEILEMYLNDVAYGGTAYGIQEASRMYFEKEVGKLSLAEAALLAGLPQSPTRYSPFGPNPETANLRQKEVLQMMQVKEFIKESQRKEAENQELVFAENRIPIKAPHFVFYVREGLEETYGPKVVEQGGLEVVTSLDYKIQRLTEEVIQKEMEKLQKLNATNAAVVVLKPSTGEILAMVGSRDFFDKGNGGNVNVAIRPRQPGSSIKIVTYAYALSNGMTPSTIIPDTPVTFNVPGQPPYTPKNYEGGFRGNLSLRSALAESRNIPAVRVLASYGAENVLRMGQKMGITTWNNPSDYGLSLTLGGGEVKLIDLARVYATVANYGKRPKIISTLKVTNHKGKVLEEFSCEEKIKENIVKAQSGESANLNLEDSHSCYGEEVLDPRVAFILTDILRDNSARSPSFGSNSLLVIPNHAEIAVKTGTSNDLRDNLAIGYNQFYVVAVWVGNNDNSPMSRIASGVTGATPIFNTIISSLVAKAENHDWETPEKLVRLPICPLTGTLACDGCPVRQEWFLEENKPEVACNPEWFKLEDQETKNKESLNEDEVKIDIDNRYFEFLLEEQKKLKKRNRDQ